MSIHKNFQLNSSILSTFLCLGKIRCIHWCILPPPLFRVRLQCALTKLLSIYTYIFRHAASKEAELLAKISSHTIYRGRYMKCKSVMYIILPHPLSQGLFSPTIISPFYPLYPQFLGAFSTNSYILYPF